MKRFFITFFAMIAIAASTNANNLNSVRDEALMHIDHYNNLYHGYDWKAKKRAEKEWKKEMKKRQEWERKRRKEIEKRRKKEWERKRQLEK